MKNSNNKSRMNPILIKALSIGATGLLSCFALVGLDILPASPTMDILATMVALMVAGLSLYYVYLEHSAVIDEEYRLACSLTNEIYADKSLALSKSTISEGIQNVLNTQPNHLLRIQALQYYKKDRLALDQLLKSLTSGRQEIEVLADSGLNWCPDYLVNRPEGNHLR